jgi:hypothetical protein
MDVAGGFGRSPKQMEDLAAKRRGMLDEDVAKIGADFKANDGIVRSIGKSCTL